MGDRMNLRETSRKRRTAAEHAAVGLLERGHATYEGTALTAFCSRGECTLSSEDALCPVIIRDDPVAVARAIARIFSKGV